MVKTDPQPQPTGKIKPQPQPTVKTEAGQQQAFVHLRQGVEKYGKGNFKEAVGDYSKAIQLQRPTDQP